ncbi:MAG: hypothetical protein IIA60_14560 [Candidatus Marinimicrobia bacterium]|nr:hypothetical protein [Candidatus Neomarinimicrobiota bacterium]
MSISDPANPMEVGYYDFYPGEEGLYAGNWGTYPYSSSGLIYSSSMSGSGVHILEYPSPVDIRHTPPRDSENLTDPFEFNIQLSQMPHTPLDLSSLAAVSGLDGDFTDSTALIPLDIAEAYKVSIPNPGTAGQLRYYFRVNDLDGNVITEPYGAPNAWFSFNVGPDQVPPEIHYVTSAEGQGSIRISGEFPITAVVSDNIAIDEVHLLYSVDGAPEVDLLMARTGIITEYQYPDVRYLYETTLTWEDVSLPASIEYYVVCIDSTSQHNQVVSSTNILELGAYELVDDFENGLDKWDLSQGWGESAFGADASLAAHDSPVGDYPDNSSNSLTLSRPYDLSPFESAILSFSHMYLVWPNQDSCLVKLSKDSLNWEVVAAYTGWQVFHVVDSIDITSWTGLGAETVYFRFTLKSDSAQTADGWHLDNIEILVQLPSTGTDPDGGTNPTTYRLAQNYPNPFNPTTTIRFELPEAADISIVVYDLMGREIERLVEGPTGPGYHQVIWDGRDRRGRKVPTGIYIARLLATPTSASAVVAAEYRMSIKMLLLK